MDESNVVSSVRVLGRKLDWDALRDFLTKGEEGRQLVEMVVYAGLPPPMPEWQVERDKKNKFLHWLRSHGYLVVAKDGSPGDGRHYKANVDVLMAIDAVELSVEMRPDVVVLVTGDAHRDQAFWNKEIVIAKPFQVGQMIDAVSAAMKAAPRSSL